MNSGIHDGLNLAQKLVEAWHGADHEALLARYDRQRRPTAEKYVQAQSIANKKLLEENDPEAREKRLKELEFTATDVSAKHTRDMIRLASATPRACAIRSGYIVYMSATDLQILFGTWQWLLNASSSWDFFVSLSGADYPSFDGATFNSMMLI